MSVDEIKRHHAFAVEAVSLAHTLGELVPRADRLNAADLIIEDGGWDSLAATFLSRLDELEEISRTWPHFSVEAALAFAAGANAIGDVVLPRADSSVSNHAAAQWIARGASSYLATVRRIVETSDDGGRREFDRGECGIVREHLRECEASRADPREYYLRLSFPDFNWAKCSLALEREAVVAIEWARKHGLDSHAAASGGQGGEAGDDPPAANIAEQPPSLEARAIALLTDHPDWSDTRIAASLQCNRGSLYRLPKYKAARELLRRDGIASLDRGNRCDGRIEAWEFNE